MTQQNKLLSLDDEILDQVAGGTGLCIDPCKLVEGALSIGAEVASKGVALVEGALSCLPTVNVSVGVGANCAG